MTGSLFISGLDWLWPASGFLALSLLLLFWGYRNAPATGGVRAICVLLKLLGLVALAACLLEPLWTSKRAKPGANYFVVLSDNSMGMQIKDRGDTRSRADHLREVVAEKKDGWQNKLEDMFQLRRYLFDSRLQATKDFSELAFDGRASAIGHSLRTIADRYRGQPVAGVLLLSDGNATDIAAANFDHTGLPPVYPVLIGDNEPAKDIAVSNVKISQTSFEDAPVTIQADVAHSGYSSANFVAKIIEVASRGNTNTTNIAVTAQKTVAEQTTKSIRDDELVPFRFQVKPDKSGILFYQLQVAAKGEQDEFINPQLTTEATLANNTRTLVVDRGKGPYRILYVSGRPNWEYKFMQRALDEDDQVQLVALIRVAKREPKFAFRAKGVDAANPLFQGFDNKPKEEAERYDQPVLIRLNTRDQVELRGGFPKTADELYAYHALIVDDLESEFFTPDQLMLIQKFVSERGGGFLMLGGQESLQQGRFSRTAVGDMLPVYLDQSGEALPVSDLRLSLTREGLLQPWARLRNNESDEKTRLGGMPPFQVLNNLRGIKPGASVIASVADSSGANHPALVVHRYGNGRSAAMPIGDLWRWGLLDREHHRDMDKAWRQMIRWLVSDVPNRVELTAEPKAGDPNQTMVLQVRVRDKKFKPLDNAKVTVAVQWIGESALPSSPSPLKGVKAGVRGETDPQHVQSSSAAAAESRTNIIRITAEQSLADPGIYLASYVPRQPGGYFADARVTDSAGAEVGHAAAGWSADPAAEEFKSLKPNRALMELIAKKTGGEVITASKLDDFARALPSKQVPVTENWTVPFWHQPLVFIFALACFIAEWGIRRLKGLV
jgi:uncharacterized membrane protein